jgi:hypothetical protein
VVPTIEAPKVFLMFFRALYRGSRFYHTRDVDPDQTPCEALEERQAIAAQIVMLEQSQAQSGSEFPGDKLIYEKDGIAVALLSRK